MILLNNYHVSMSFRPSMIISFPLPLSQLKSLLHLFDSLIIENRGHECWQDANEGCHLLMELVLSGELMLGVLCFPCTWELSHRESESEPCNGTPLFTFFLSAASLFQAAAGQVSLQSQQDKQGMGPAGRGLAKAGPAWPTWPPAIWSFVCEGEAVDVVFLDISKVVEMVSCNTLLEKLAAHGLNRWLCWVESCLHGGGITGVNVPAPDLQADLFISTHSLGVSYTLEHALCGEVVWFFFQTTGW